MVKIAKASIKIELKLAETPVIDSLCSDMPLFAAVGLVWDYAFQPADFQLDCNSILNLSTCILTSAFATAEVPGPTLVMEPREVE